MRGNAFRTATTECARPRISKRPPTLLEHITRTTTPRARRAVVSELPTEGRAPPPPCIARRRRGSTHRFVSRQSSITIEQATGNARGHPIDDLPDRPRSIARPREDSVNLPGTAQLTRWQKHRGSPRACATRSTPLNAGRNAPRNPRQPSTVGSQRSHRRKGGEGGGTSIQRISHPPSPPRTGHIARRVHLPNTVQARPEAALQSRDQGTPNPKKRNGRAIEARHAISLPHHRSPTDDHVQGRCHYAPTRSIPPKATQRKPGTEHPRPYHQPPATP